MVTLVASQQKFHCFAIWNKKQAAFDRCGRAAFSTGQPT
jgi:hypothetical protein